MPLKWIRWFCKWTLLSLCIDTIFSSTGQEKHRECMHNSVQNGALTRKKSQPDQTKPNQTKPTEEFTNKQTNSKKIKLEERNKQLTRIDFYPILSICGLGISGVSRNSMVSIQSQVMGVILHSIEILTIIKLVMASYKTFIYPLSFKVFDDSNSTIYI